MSIKSFTEQTKDWVIFLKGVKKCYFIGGKSKGQNGEEYGNLCMKPSMKGFMEYQGWYYQEYPCGFFNGKPGSCTNGDVCHFGHKYSPRWVKAKPRRNFGSSSQASSRDNTSDEETTISDEVSVVSMPSVSSTQTLNLVRPSPTSGGSGAWSDVVQGYSDIPEIKMWEERLLKTKKKKKDFLKHPDYCNEHEKQQNKLSKLDEKIKLCETEIRRLKQDRLAEDSDTDDGW